MRFKQGNRLTLLLPILQAQLPSEAEEEEEDGMDAAQGYSAAGYGGGSPAYEDDYGMEADAGDVSWCTSPQVQCFIVLCTLAGVLAIDLGCAAVGKKWRQTCSLAGAGIVFFC